MISVEFTDKDIATVKWVGDRYCWSSVMLKHLNLPGTIILTHDDLLEIRDECKKDSEGGHVLFPCLAPGTPIWSKMVNIYSEGQKLSR